MAALLAMILTATVPQAAPKAAETCTVWVDICKGWGSSWTKGIQDALGRLEGVVSVSLVPDTKYTIELKVLEAKALLPTRIKRALPEAGDYAGARIEIKGVAIRKGDKWLFEARGSRQGYVLIPNDDLKDLLPLAGKAAVIISGKLDEADGKGAQRKGTPMIKVTSVAQIQEEPKK